MGMNFKKPSTKGGGCLMVVAIFFLLSIVLAIYSLAWVPGIIAVIVFALQKNVERNTKIIRIGIASAVVITSLITFYYLNNDSENANSDKTNNQTTEDFKNEITSNEKDVLETTDEFSFINSFVEQYNSSTTNPITDITDMDIQGEDYRTEYRLGAFDKAVGKKGKINGETIDIVNYGTWENDSIRIYITAPTLDLAKEIFIATIQVWDKTLTENEIMEEFDAASIYLGETGYITGYVNEDYSNGGIAGYEIMLDCTKLNFIDDK